MDRTEVIRNILDMEHQAQALAQDANYRKEHLDASIEAEIDEIRTRYQREAEQYLADLEKAQEDLSTQRFQELDEHLHEKLEQVDTIFKEHKEEWVEAIFQRIVGKAGG